MKHFLLFTVFAVFSLISTQGIAQNLVPNGDMESGVDDWTTNFRKGSEGTIAVSSDAANGSQAMLIDVTTASTDANPDLSHGQAESAVYSPEEWTDRATYKLSANLKSNTTENELKWKILPLDADGNKQHIAGLKNEDESFLHLTTEYKNYRWLVNNVKSGYDQGFYFQMQVGLNVAQYFVDDLTLEKVVGIENGGFEDDEDLFAMSTNVTTETGAAANFTIDTENVNTGSKSLKVDVTASNDTVGAVNLVTDTRFYPELGKKYEFTFYAKGTGANDSISMDLNYYDGENNFLTMNSKMVKLTNEYQKYSTIFEAETADQNSVRFRIGFGKQVSTIYIDDMTYGDANETTPATVVDVIVNSDDHETLEAAVIAADLAGTLSGEGPFTVFAPTDDAFDALPEGALDALLADPSGDLTDILLYHVVGDSVMSGMLSDGMKVETLHGDSVTVTISDGKVYINEAMVTLADIVAGNGVVHVIDAVLLPPTEPIPATVVDVIVNSDDHETLEAAVIAADLAGTLSGEGPFTVFAPTDAAFAALPEGTLDALLADPSGDLTDILLYHVVGDSVMSGMLSDGMKVETLFGDSISVMISEGNVYINDAMVTVADIVAGNGVVHVIDAVLIPDLNTSVDDLYESTLRVYPNPATTILNVEGLELGADIEVFSITGVVVKRIQVAANPTTINLNELVQGTYILRSGENITRFIKK